MKRIIIRTLGGKRIGYGHFYRCLSLAKALMMVQGDLEITFLINEELVDLIERTPFAYQVAEGLEEDLTLISDWDLDLFVFDSYLGNDEYLREVKKHTKLMLIDDNNDLYNSTIPDILYNGNIHAPSLRYRKREGQLQLLGSKYLIMKEEYWTPGDDQEFEKEGVLVTTGGSDEQGIALKLLETLKNIEERLTLIIGPGYSEEYISQLEELKNRDMKFIYKPASLKEYISRAEIVVTAGGSTVYETLNLGTKLIIYSLADNQNLLCQSLRKMGIPYLGKYPELDYAALGQLIAELRTSEVKREKPPYSLISGDGALVVARKSVEM